VRVNLYTLGGTIAMAGRDGVGGGGAVARLSGADLLAHVPGLPGTGIDVRVEDVRAVPSACLRMEDLLDLAERAGAAVAAGDGPCGVVVLQGTDTIEETAFLLDLVWPEPAPIVVTGAMRNASLAGPDGPANVLAAIRLASSEHARDRGCLVAFNDEIHAARWVRKTHSASTATFASPDTGPVGFFVEGEPTFFVPARHRDVLARPVGKLPPVALYTVTLDDDGAMLHGISDRYAGLVVAAFGVGHVPDWLAAPLGEIAARIPVVLASRTGSGPVFAATYGYAGSESDLHARGLISAGMLHPYKARILLRMLLAYGADRNAIAARFRY
jgi:L-asparaginase